MLSAGGCGGSDSGTGADHGGTAANRRRRGSRGITEGAEGIARMIHPPASVAGVSVSDGLRHAQELRRAASVGAGAPGTGCVRRALVCLRQPPARSPEDSVLGPRRICGMEQTIRGRDVRDAAGGERGGTPAGDYSTGVGGPAEWNRHEAGRAAQAISALLRELPDARRNRKSEQLSADQLALFAAAWEARQATEEPEPSEGPKDPDNDTKPDAGPTTPKKNGGGRQPLRIHPGTTDGDRGCLQEIRLRLHHQDGHQAVPADRKEHRRSEPSGAGDRGQNGRPPAVAPAREDL